VLTIYRTGTIPYQVVFCEKPYNESATRSSKGRFFTFAQQNPIPELHSELLRRGLLAQFVRPKRGLNLFGERVAHCPVIHNVVIEPLLNDAPRLSRGKP
jgi:hypothetical protein